MGDIVVTPLGDSRTSVHHESSGATFETDSSPEWGGKGRSFSATDLVAAGLGACIGSSIAPVLDRRGIAPDSVRVRLTKTLGTEPKQIDHITVRIVLPEPADERTKKVVLKAAGTCAVGRSLGCTYDVALA